MKTKPETVGADPIETQLRMPMGLEPKLEKRK